MVYVALNKAFKEDWGMILEVEKSKEQATKCDHSIGYKISSIQQLIERQAILNPTSQAVSLKGVTLTYQQLNERANQLAHYLIKKGVKAETLVGVSLQRSLEMVIAVLAVLKAGGAYVPIALDYPTERANFMLKDSGFTILLTEKFSVEKLSLQKIKTIYLDGDWQQIELESKENPSVMTKPHHVAYVLYTSGSMGNPKGVMVTHGSVLNAYYAWEKVYELKEIQSHLQMANFSFDVFTGDFVRALGSGAKLVLCPKDILLEPQELYQLMVKEKVRCAEFVPTVLRRLMEYLEVTGQWLDFMNIVICGSDNWSMNEYQKLQRLCGAKTRVINSYGLTEATIDSTYFEANFLEEDPSLSDRSVPLGKPFPNTEIYLLDDDLNQVPRGAIGEIYIAGPGIAKGYLNRKDLTTKKFIKHSFDDESEIRLCKTGDRGRYLQDGNIEFLGRIDNQIKLRGMRVELSDIENVLNCHFAIRESLVALSSHECEQRLTAYIVLEQELMPCIRDLRAFLEERLPSYMIPSTFVRLETLPLTPNGKLDRRALKVSGELSLGEDYVKPRDGIERELADIWAALLGIEKVGIFDHFFDLGGDSLLLARLNSELEKKFPIKIPLCESLKVMTIAELSAYLKKNSNTLTDDNYLLNNKKAQIPVASPGAYPRVSTSQMTT